MLGHLDKLLGKFPANGFKTFLGWALFVGADMLPNPAVGLALKHVGEALIALGLLHKGVKESV